MSGHVRTVTARALVALAVVLALFATLTSAQFPKRGLAYNEDIDITGFGGGEVFWQYNWDSDTAHSQSSYTEYVPMLWSDQAVHTSVWNQNIAKWLNKGDLPTTHLLGFNECDNPGQSSMTPADAANSYRQWITPYANKATLVGPSVTNGAAGMPWMKEFWSLCSDCKIDFAAFHWYDSTSNFAYLQKYVTEACALVAPAKIWLTEFEGLPDDPVVQSQFMTQAIPWLDDNPYVDRYAWFGSADPDTNLLVGTGPELSALGKQYVNEAFDKLVKRNATTIAPQAETTVTKPSRWAWGFNL